MAAAAPETTIPRRVQLERLTPAEHAIRKAVLAVEALPADVRLTDAVILLGQARNKVADFVDGVPRAEPRQDVASELLDVLVEMVEEKVEYMRINLLGNPEKQHTIK